MTIDETIRRYNEQALDLERKAIEAHEDQLRKIELATKLAIDAGTTTWTSVNCTKENDLRSQSEEYRQIATWLVQYRDLKQEITKFSETLKNSYIGECLYDGALDFALLKLGESVRRFYL